KQQRRRHIKAHDIAVDAYQLCSAGTPRRRIGREADALLGSRVAQPRLRTHIRGSISSNSAAQLGNDIKLDGLEKKALSRRKTSLRVYSIIYLRNVNSSIASRSRWQWRRRRWSKKVAGESFGCCTVARECSIAHGRHPHTYTRCTYKRESNIRELLDRGANPSLASNNGFTPLHIVCRIFENFENDLSRRLFELPDGNYRPLQINAQNESGNTLLHYASKGDHKFLFELLLRGGAGIDSSAQVPKSAETATVGGDSSTQHSAASTTEAAEAEASHDHHTAKDRAEQNAAEREEEDDEDEDDKGKAEEAAIRIQAAFRGHQTRKTIQVQKRDDDCNNLQHITRDVESSSNTEPTREELEAEFREDDKGKIKAAQSAESSDQDPSDFPRTDVEKNRSGGRRGQGARRQRGWQNRGKGHGVIGVLHNPPLQYGYSLCARSVLEDANGRAGALFDVSLFPSLFFNLCEPIQSSSWRARDSRAFHPPLLRRTLVPPVDVIPGAALPSCSSRANKKEPPKHKQLRSIGPRCSVWGASTPALHCVHINLKHMEQQQYEDEDYDHVNGRAEILPVILDARVHHPEKLPSFRSNTAARATAAAAATLPTVLTNFPVTDTVNELEGIDLSDPDLHKAATKIQASFRGHKVRQEVVPNPDEKK
ncbi:unnamed protein product, partial [Trichogramma brassicae]